MIKRPDIEKEVRHAMGSMGVAKFTSDDMVRCVERGIRRYSRNRGQLVMGTITTVQDQAAYTYDTAVVAKIEEILQLQGADESDRFEMESLRLAGSSDQGGSIYDNPSLDYIRAYKRSSMRHFRQPSWLDANGAVWLVPAPATSGATIKYVYRRLMTVPDQEESLTGDQVGVPDSELDILAMACQIDVMESLLMFMTLSPRTTDRGKSQSYDIPAMRQSLQGLKMRFDIAAHTPRFGGAQ